jgi:hypothetical protein
LNKKKPDPAKNQVLFPFINPALPGETMTNYTTNKKSKSKKRNKKPGNNCGHCPNAPRYFIPPVKHAIRPFMLVQLILAVTRYFANPNVLPLLNAANGSGRQQRSERREACVALLCCMLHYLDLVTLRVGIPQHNGSMAGLDMPFLAELSGLGLRRAERAMHDLKDAGIISVHPICEKISDAVYKGIAAIRTVSVHLFTAMGFDAWLRHERQKAADRKKKKETKKNKKAMANVQMGLNALGNKAKPEAAAVPATRTNAFENVASHIARIKKILEPQPG